MITPEEIRLAEETLAFALASGAGSVRITLNKSLQDLVAMRDGALDKVTHSLDRSLQLTLFADGRFGSFSINRLEKKALEEFTLDALATLRLLAPDSLRSLPAPERTAKDAVTGLEAGLFDPAHADMDASARLDLARRSTIWARKASLEDGFTIISEEEEYSDSISDSLLIDSNGTRCRHTDTSYEISCEVTVQDPSGARFSGFWWDSRPFLKDLTLEDCALTAARRAAAAIGPVRCDGGLMSIVVETGTAAKLVAPILNTLGGFAIQQKNSFLADKLGEALFPPCLSVVDRPHEAGQTGSRLFDSEGVATRERPIIDKGVVSTFFLNSYIARKLGMEPTVEDAVRPCVVPFGGCRTREDVLRRMDSGILVTAFNGGNSNSSTGDFSYGIEGFRFAGGEILHPVREMLVTGNFISLWQRLALTADDARPCLSRRIPTLAFTEVDFSG